MRVEDVTGGDAEFIEPNAPVVAVAARMGELEIGAPPVGSADRLGGIVTDRDILNPIVARWLDATATPVGGIASRPVIDCRLDDTVQTAMDLMPANHIRRMPVRNEAGAVVGWVTLADLARKLLVDGTAMQDALQDALQVLTEATN